MKRVFLALLLAIAIGIASRLVHLRMFFWDSAVGDILYAVVAYLLIVLVTRRRPFPDAFSAAMLYCTAIELFKLTGIPARLWRYWPARWILGTTFSVTNLAFYVLGITGIAMLDKFYLRRGRR